MINCGKTANKIAKIRIGICVFVTGNAHFITGFYTLPCQRQSSDRMRVRFCTISAIIASPFSLVAR